MLLSAPAVDQRPFSFFSELFCGAPRSPASAHHLAPQARARQEITHTPRTQQLPTSHPTPPSSQVVSQWDADFVDVQQEVLFELILAANYMDIKPLLDLTCAKVPSRTTLSSYVLAELNGTDSH